MTCHATLWLSQDLIANQRGEQLDAAHMSIKNVSDDECTCLPWLLPLKPCRLELSCQLFTEISDCIGEFRDVTQLVLNQNKIARIACLDPLQQLACLCEYQYLQESWVGIAGKELLAVGQADIAAKAGAQLEHGHPYRLP